VFHKIHSLNGGFEVTTITEKFGEEKHKLENIRCNTTATDERKSVIMNSIDCM